MKKFTAPDMNLVGRMIKSCEAQKPFTIKHGTSCKQTFIEPHHCEYLLPQTSLCCMAIITTCVEKGFFTKISLCKPVYLYHIAK